MKAVYLLLVILIFTSGMVQCRPLPECEDRNCLSNEAITRALIVCFQKKNECFPTTVRPLEVRKRYMTEQHYDRIG
ncbi:hypothetical protein TSAR_007069 [Trichomalopsis sarcophagae]|uniref:Uncharacterized protein n=1 Tax=Trichomalopsis sarcophagae TaxID=543379 RepID=A0A232FP00_9HYME|nr:hypothetical protein TSAR_007069 [Trichomalopsis sarcophagae]